MSDRSLYQERETRRIDYALMSREYPKLKGALTRARNSGDPVKVLRAVERFLKLSDEVGCMPDDWSRWRNALEDAYDDFQRSDDGETDYYENAAKVTRQFQAAAASLNC